MDPIRAPTPNSYSAPSIDGSRAAMYANGSIAATPKTTSLNERLNTDFVDVGEDADTMGAQITKSITEVVGEHVTPRLLLIALRILKAITFCFLILTVAADLMYIIFLEILADREVKDLAGGRRDLIIRIYGLFLAGVALAIELDYVYVVKSFYGFKGFIPRSLLIFFVSAITGAHPLHAEVKYSDDDAAAYNEIVIPQSAVVFQMVTSFILGLCAVCYFVFGCLCFDRFTSKAFLSTNDPVASTAIAPPSTVQTEKRDATGPYAAMQEPL
eukprot:Nitzschia sp. Nitz4//scaffold112_size70979//13341//14233//NITZ4_005894-RA/size70979-augustus-gene-0.79-mRNA-1//1//CDS//3329533241//6197//frame0